METNDRPRTEDASETPPRFVAALRARFAREVHIPAEVDARILAHATSRLSGGKRRVFVIRWAAVSAAAAAALLAVLLSLPAKDAPHMASSVRAVSAKEDIDGDGKVDIVDAFVLAKHMEASRGLEPQYDFNADGTVDRKDVDVVAMAAVSLNRRGVL